MPVFLKINSFVVMEKYKFDSFVVMASFRSGSTDMMTRNVGGHQKLC